MQKAAAGFVLSEGGAALAVGGEEPHELAVGFFVPRFDGEQLAGGLDAGQGLLGVYGRFHKLIQMGNGRLPDLPGFSAQSPVTPLRVALPHRPDRFSETCQVNHKD